MIYIYISICLLTLGIGFALGLILGLEISKRGDNSDELDKHIGEL